MLRWWLPTLSVVLCAGSVLANPTEAPAQRKNTGPLDPAGLAAKIDQLIEAQWAEKGVKPAPLADDAEFLRRAYLDLAGRIPRVSEIREFLADKSADKRARVVEHLLDVVENPRYVTHLSNTWRAILLPPNNNQQFQF